MGKSAEDDRELDTVARSLERLHGIDDMASKSIVRQQVSRPENTTGTVQYEVLVS